MPDRLPAGTASATALSPLGALAVAFAALAGASAVALGAWASHGAAEPAKGWLVTASTYQMVHAAALLGAALLRERVLAGWPRRLMGAALAGFALGILLFCGGLTALAFGWRVPAAAPAGGLALMAAWLCLAAGALAGLRRG